MKRINVLTLVVLLALASPSVAAAQIGPTNVPAPLTQPPDDGSDATPFEEDSGLTTLQLVLIFGSAIAMIAFIAWFIMRDAHRAAPATERGHAQPAKSGAGGAAGGSVKAKSAREREREKARKRNKAKAAREQRKRNRPR